MREAACDGKAACADYDEGHPGGWCIYWPQFKDRYLSDRLRWQYWTLRYE